MLTSILVSLLLTTTASSVTGEYYEGEGLGVNWSLQLKADGAYSFTWVGCAGEYGRSSGKWTEKDGLVRLTPSSVEGMADRLPLVYTVVRWGGRIYLIEEKEFPDFAAYVHQGWEPRKESYGVFFLRTTDHRRKPRGMPEVPEQYRELFLQKPVRARLSAFDGSRGTISAGSTHGLRTNMLVTTQDLASCTMRVTALSDASATVEPEHGCRPIVGTAVSTLLYDAALQESSRKR